MLTLLAKQDLGKIHGFIFKTLATIVSNDYGEDEAFGKVLGNFLIDFKKEGRRERHTHQRKKDIPISCLLHNPNRNRTCNLPVHGMMLQLNHTGQS